MSERVARIPVAASTVSWVFVAGQLVKRHQALTGWRP
jgi:hypothetical protein